MSDEPKGGHLRPELELSRLALELGAESFGGDLSAKECEVVRLARDLPAPVPERIADARSRIRQGEDPLGEVLFRRRSPLARRRLGAVYTPAEVVKPMVSWTLRMKPTRVVDAGCGTGRYSAAVARRNQRVEIIAIDLDPVATLMTRATLNVLGAPKARVLNEDFTQLHLPVIDGRTAFLGNPPYIRHHRLSSELKDWLIETAEAFGQSDTSTRAGLHAYFFFAARKLGKHGDVGCFITASEWLDVGYGRGVRSLLLDGLGAQALDVVHPQTRTYQTVDSTALVTCFRIGAKVKSIHLRQVQSLRELKKLATGPSVDAVKFRHSNRWTSLLRTDEGEAATGKVRVALRELFRIRRGIATGANDYFVMTNATAKELGLMRWCIPVITRAAEILESEGAVAATSERKVLFYPNANEKRRGQPKLNSYICKGERPRKEGRICDRYLCQRRDPWWALERPDPAPVVATYMARQPPMFATNADKLALLNIGHYLYPRHAELDVAAVVRELNGQRDRLVGRGRTYQGGLEKFEPGEMLDLEVDLPEHLVAHVRLSGTLAADS